MGQFLRHPNPSCSPHPTVWHGLAVSSAAHLLGAPTCFSRLLGFGRLSDIPTSNLFPLCLPSTGVYGVQPRTLLTVSNSVPLCGPLYKMWCLKPINSEILQSTSCFKYSGAEFSSLGCFIHPCPKLCHSLGGPCSHIREWSSLHNWPHTSFHPACE